MTRNKKSPQGSSHARKKALRLGKGSGRRAEEAAAQLEDRIAKRAYEIHVEHGRCSGHALEDWLQAERELVGERG